MALKTKALPAQGPASELDALIPQEGPDFAVAFLLAALRKDGASWLGKQRVGLLAQALGLDEANLLKLLDRQPRPPAALGEANAWVSRRLPLLCQGRVVWVDLFWRPDRTFWRRALGTFAVRLVLPHTGAVEIRGRIEEARLDLVMTAESITRLAAVNAMDLVTDVLRKLGLKGGLMVRNLDGKWSEIART